MDAQIGAQRSLGHLEPVDAGLVGIARTLADAMDYEWTASEPSSFTISALAGKLTTVLLRLRGDQSGAGADLDVELERLRAEIRDAARSRPPDAQ